MKTTMMSNSGGNHPSKKMQRKKHHDSAIQVRGGDRYDDRYRWPFYRHKSDGFWDKVLPMAGALLKSCLVVTLGLYILNQKHLLPKPLSAVVSKVLFWPTLPITVGRRLGAWSTVVDDTVIIGGAPFGFVQLPERLYYEYGVCVKSLAFWQSRTLSVWHQWICVQCTLTKFIHVPCTRFAG